MKNIVLLFLSVIWLSACSQQSSSDNSPKVSNDNSDLFVEVSNLQSLGTISIDTSASLLDFGTANPTTSSLSKVITFKNDLSTPVDLTIGALTTASGFIIKTNRCASSIPAKSSCAITISFSSRGLFTGPTYDFLPISSGSSQDSIKLTATIENQTDPNTADPLLVYTLAGTSSGKTLTVKNTGIGNASNIVVTPPAGYYISLSRCGVVLKTGQSCVVTLVFSNYRSQTQPTIGTIAVTAKGTVQLPSASLSILDGTPVVSQYQLRIAKPSSAITVTSSKSSCSGSCAELVESYNVGETANISVSSSNEKLAVIGWSGDCASATTSCALVMNSNKNPVIVTEERVYFISLNKTGVFLIYGIPDVQPDYHVSYSYINSRTEYDTVYAYLIKPGTTYITSHSSNPDYVYKWGGLQSSCGYAETCQITVNQDFENFVQYFKKSVDCANPPENSLSYKKEYVVANDGYSDCEIKECKDGYNLVAGACVDHNIGVQGYAGHHSNFVVDNGVIVLANGSPYLNTGNTGILAGKKVSMIDADDSISCLIANSSIYCAGQNNSGQLGIGSFTGGSSPLSAVTGLVNKKMKSLAVGIESPEFVCALDDLGKVYCWGSNEWGSLGNGGSATSNMATPTQIMSLDNKQIVSIAAGNVFACAVDSLGAAYCWGASYDHQLGSNSTTGFKDFSPVSVYRAGAVNNNKLISVAAGGTHACALDDQGKVYCWGDNYYGSLGDGTRNWSNVPVSVNTSGVMAGKFIKQIASGTNHTCALDDQGKMYCWGSNNFRQLGGGSSYDQDKYTSPVAVDTSGFLNNKIIESISANGHSTCATDTNKKVYCWGSAYFVVGGQPNFSPYGPLN